MQLKYHVRVTQMVGNPAESRNTILKQRGMHIPHHTTAGTAHRSFEFGLRFRPKPNVGTRGCGLWDKALGSGLGITWLHTWELLPNMESKVGVYKEVRLLFDHNIKPDVLWF